MDTTIDELRAGWEQIREKVKALQITAQFYAERNQQLIDENRELRGEIQSHDRAIDDLVAVNQEMNELLWWVTANNHRRDPEYNYRSWITIWDIFVDERQLLATQGYTRESLEKRNG